MLITKEGGGKMKNINKNLPNILSLIRICLTPVVVALFLLPYSACKFLAFGVYVIASCTDFLDGYIARKYNLVSDIGKLLDSSADKFLQTSALILVLINEYNVVSTWISIVLILVFLLRDAWMNTVRQLCASKGEVIAADMWGKVKSIIMDIALGVMFLYSALCAVCIHGKQTLLFADLTLEYIGCFGLVLLVISSMFSIFSAVNYTKNAWGCIVKGSVNNNEEINALDNNAKDSKEEQKNISK